MCSPCSNADRPSEPIQEAERFLLHHTPPLGRYGQWFVRGLWSRAIRQAYQDSLQLVDYAHRHGVGQVEEACQFALLYDLDSPSAVRLLLGEDPDDHDPDLTGQLHFSFAQR